jgi:CheY-like chemotaxis protein
MWPNRGWNPPNQLEKRQSSVMDDEEIHQEVARRDPCHLGYRAEFCKDGAEAIDIYRAPVIGETFDTVLMDLPWDPGGKGGMETMKPFWKSTLSQKGLSQ